MGDHICDDSKLIIQVTGHGHDNQKKQPQQLMFYKDNYKTPQEAIKLKEGTTKLQEDEYPSRYECPSILFEYPECDAKGSQLAIKIPKEGGGEIILPLLDKVVGGTANKDPFLYYKSHRIWAIVPMTKIHSPAEVKMKSNGTNFTEHKTFSPVYALAREGYFYVFINGKLWREVKIIQEDEKTYYQDIDLAIEKTTQAPREPSGVKLDNIWIPAAFPNTKLTIQLAYSEDQWSKERIAYLEREETQRNTRCDTIKDNTTITRPSSMAVVSVPENNAPFQLTKLPPVRARNFDHEVMLDNPNGYLKSLAKDYLKDIIEINSNTFNCVNDKNNYATIYTNRLSTVANYHLDTGAWINLIHQKDTINNKELKALAEFWPTATKYTTYQSGTLPELTDISSPTQKVTNALDSHQKHYILGVIVHDDIYTLHHTSSRISIASLLLEKLETLAAKRPSHYLATLVNEQRKYFTNIDDALGTIDYTVKQNFLYSLASLERDAVVSFIKQSQTLLYETLIHARTRLAIADLLSNHNPIDYGGHMYFVLVALNAIASPEYSYDPLTIHSQTALTNGQRLIQNITKGARDYKDFTLMLQTAKADTQILKELEEYLKTSTEPTDNQGDGAFRASVLKELNKQLKANSVFKARSYNGKNIAELIDKLDKTSGEKERSKKIVENTSSGAITTLKGISSVLMGIATNLQNAALEIEKKETRFRNIQNQQKPTSTKQKSSTTTPTKRATTENIQQYQANMYYNLREIMPDIFQDLRFVPINTNTIAKGYIVGVGEAIETIANMNHSMGGALPRAEYNTDVRMVQVKEGSQLEALFKELDSDIKSSHWNEAYKTAAEQLWNEEFAPRYKSKDAAWHAENKEKILSSTEAKEKITHRMVQNVMNEDIKNSAVVDYGTGKAADMIDNRISYAESQAPEKLKAVRESYDGATKEYSQKTQVAANIGKSTTLEKINKALNSKTVAGIFLAIEFYNIIQFRAQTAALEESQGTTRVYAGALSIGIDTLSTSLFLIERINFVKASQKLTMALDKPIFLSLSSRALLSKAGVGLGVSLSLSDAFDEMTQGHTDRMALNIVSAAGLALMYFSGEAAAGTLLLGLGPVGIFGLAMMLLATGALILCQTTDLEDWFQQGPFANFNATWMPAAKGWLVIPEEAYYRLISLFANINIRAEKYTPKPINQAANSLSAEAQKKISQANVKVTLTSNLPGLINMKLNKEDTQIYFQPTYSSRYIRAKQGVDVKYTKLYEHETPNGREIYLQIHNQGCIEGKTSLKVWAQVKATLTYFNTQMECRFPAPAPSKDVLWNEKLYSKPDFQKDSMPFWLTQTLSNIV